ncbi:unnamed protein product [Rotaria magnacalcarata]|uniref:Uncharacterized protein n=1 Tax=Rotaria magnacalcarata TaxID=392030 RepID=A0A816PW62_9BILA|nr:unnamed protein product [Rotaria magnacalcarata]CAF2132226.1 unnamed protein product [Rotaria magnacalcarata]CAF3951870.1 unnamed protein product [Rotaria magnacalcarata]CAF4020610.1 unnamed protein product [Rotaria magnacalcarata]
MALSNNKDYSTINENFILFKACEQGDLQTLENSLNSLSSSDIKLIRDEQQATLVHYAARYGHLSILEYLVNNKNLDISQLRTEHGATCAHDAAVCDQVETLNYIFHYHQLNNHNRPDSFQKLRWTVRDEQGNTPLHLAAAYGSMRTLRYLIERESADPHIRSYNGFQPIHYAASSGHISCVKLLLSIAPDTVNEQTNTLLTPIYLACQYGSNDTIKILSSCGANFNLRDENGLNCLHAACQSSHLHVVQWLVDTQNANIDDVDYMNNTPLHYAAAVGNEAILTYLLEKNAQIIASSNGNTPLHVAAENGHQAACAILIERGSCSVTLRNSSQLTPVDLANQYGFPELANELRLRKTSLPYYENSSPVSSKIQLENATIIRLVVKKRNVERFDAANQVDENELTTNTTNEMNSSAMDGSFSSKKLTNERFDLSELRARVEKHEASRISTMTSGDIVSNVLMHSMDSLNQQNKSRRRAKVASERYAPWLKTGNMTPEAFEQEIQKIGSNLRKVRRDSLLKTEETDSNFDVERSRQSRSLGRPVIVPTRTEELSLISDGEYSNNQNSRTSKRLESERSPSVVPVTKSHQFTASSSTMNSHYGKPDWQRALVERRRTGAAE